MLQKRLMRRGVTLAAALTALALGTEAKAVVPIALIHATAKAALAYGAGQAGALSASVAALLEKASKSMSWTKAKIASALVAMIAVGAACGLASAPKEEPSAKQQAVSADEQARAKPQEDDKDALSYGGRVVDPDGKPIAGAKLYLLYYTPKELPVPVRGTSDPEGRFRFTVKKAEFDTGDSGEPWQAAMAVALADDYGLGVAPMELGKKWDPANQTLHLVKDDKPVSGRIVDLQGKPIAGVSVTVAGLHWPRKGDLAPLLQEMKERKVFYPPLRDLTLGLEGTHIDHFLGKLFQTATTDRDGRFTIKGLGRERFVTLRVEGPTIVHRTIFAATRPGGLIEVPGQWSPSDKLKTSLVYGMPFDFAAAPCKPIVGVVRDKDTGKPIPGAIVTSFQFAGSNYVQTEVQTVADRDGKYQLNGMPKGDGNVIRAGPPEGAPYLMALQSVGDSPGLEPITADFKLKRGVWIIGKVKDKETGQPARAVFDYAIFEDNPLRKEVPNLSFSSYTYNSAIDGTFKLVGLPGRGLIGVRAYPPTNQYRMSVGADQIKNLREDGHFNTFPSLLYSRNFNTLVEVNPASDAAAVIIDVLLHPGLRLTGTILDPDGKPLAGALTSGLDSNGTWGYEPLKTAEFTVQGLEKGETRLLQFFHKDKKLSGSVVIREGQKDKLTVKLAPSGTLTGRLVNADGKPVIDGEIITMNPPMAAPGVPPVDFTKGSFHENRIRVNKNGEFRIEGLVPGLKYQMGVIKGVYLHKLGGDAGDEITIEAGETKKLGDVGVKPFE